MMYTLDFYTAYSQFYIVDPVTKYDTGSDKFWTDRALIDKLAIEEGVLGVGIGSHGHVRAELTLLSSPNLDIDFTKYDHIVEAGIKIESGLLQVIDCPNSEVAFNIMIEPNTYRIRIYSAGLAGSETDEYEGEDRYKIEIWSDDELDRKVLKRYLNN